MTDTALVKYLSVLFIHQSLLIGNTDCAHVADSWKGKVPDGCLLALKLLQMYDYNHVSLFKIEFDGSVTQYWNYSYAKSHQIVSDNLFAIDVEDELVYLGVIDQFLALDLTTGQVKIKLPFKQYFWNYDYISRDKAIYGVCYSYESEMWKWCHIKLNGTTNVTLEYFYPFPAVSPVIAPLEGTYYMDKEHQTIWYFLIGLARGVNYTTGEVIFTSGEATDLCIAHDHFLNKTFTIMNNINDKPAMAELLPYPHPEKKLMELPWNLRPNYQGTCSYDPETHTFIGLMTNVSLSNYTHYYMPTHLLLINVLNLTSRIIPLPAFDEKWSSNFPITGLKFISNSNAV